MKALLLLLSSASPTWQRVLAGLPLAACRLLILAGLLLGHDTLAAPPAISSIPDQTIRENTATPPIPFTVADAEVPTDRLVVTAASSDPMLVPAGNLALGGGAAARTLVVRPAPDRNGSCVITVTVNDGTEVRSTSFLLMVLPDPRPPTIIEAPRNTHASAGETVLLSVVAMGSSPLSYQWRLNGSPIAGATEATLTLSGVNCGHAGVYSVVVWNSYGSATSAGAVLSVSPCCLGLQCSTNIIVDCQGPEGAAVHWRLMATNHCTPGDLFTSCDWRSGDTFPVGMTTVSCHAIGSGETNYCSFTVTVRDNCPQDACLDLAALAPATLPNPWETEEFKFESFALDGIPRPNNRIETLDRYTGLLCDPRLDIELRRPSAALVVEVFRNGGNMNLIAFNERGSPVDTYHLSGAATTGSEAVELSSAAGLISRVRIYSTNNPALVLRICGRSWMVHDLDRTEHCHGFADLPPGPVPNPWTVEGMTLTARLIDGELDPDSRIDDTNPDVVEPYTGYFVKYDAELLLPVPCRRVTLEFVQNSGLVDFTADGGADPGVELARARILGVPVVSEPQMVDLVSTGDPIRRVKIHSPNGRFVLRRVCYWAVEEAGCLGFDGLTDRLLPNPLILDGVRFETRSFAGEFLLHNRVRAIAGEAGLSLTPITEIQLPAVAAWVELAFRGELTSIRAEAFRSDGASAGVRIISLRSDPPVLATFAGAIARVVVNTTGTNAILTRSCGVAGRPDPTRAIGPFVPIGGTILTPALTGGLSIENPDLKFPGGIRVALGQERSLRIRFNADLPASQMPTGRLFLTTLSGLNHEYLGQIYGQQDGAGIRTEVDFTAIGSWTYGLRVFQGNQGPAELFGQKSALTLSANPSWIEVEELNDGRVRVTYGFNGPISVENDSGQWPMVDRIDWLSEPSNFGPVGLSAVDVLWNDLKQRLLPGFGFGCTTLLLPADLVIPCAPPGGTRVFYDATASNVCAGATVPLHCTPAPGDHFPLGTQLVSCFAGTVSDPAFGSFHVTLRSDLGGCLLKNPSFEAAAPAAPVEGRPFYGVFAWDVIAGDANVYLGGPGFPACDGTNYAGLRAEQVGPTFKGGAVQGHLIAALGVGQEYKVGACLNLAGGSGAWVEFVLADGDPAHDQTVAVRWVEPGLGWVRFEQTFVAAWSHDRIIIRTLAENDGIASNGYVRMDDIEVCCTCSIVITPCSGSLVPCFSVEWSGGGVLQNSTSLDANSIWTDVSLPVESKLGHHRVTMPPSANAPMMIFRLRAP